MSEVRFERTVNLLVLACLLVTVSWLLPGQVFAQSQTLTVSPAIAQIDLSKDSSELPINYTNNLPYPVKLSFKAEDFSSLSQGWQVNFLQGNDAKNYHYSLSSWVSFDQPELTINPNQTAQLKVSINSSELPPGGHYAAIIAQTEGQNAGINLKSSVATLLFVRNSTGKEVEEANIDSFDPVQNLFNQPDRYVLRFRNSGNVPLTPYGEVHVYDPLGVEVSRGILNEGSFITLPESIRRYDINTQSLKTALLPGFYTAKIAVHFGNGNHYLNSQTRFFSLGSQSYITVIIFIIVITIIWWFLRRKLKAAKDTAE